MKTWVKYVIFLTLGCVVLNIWFMAINAPADYRVIYGALSGLLTAIIVEGRKRNNEEKKP